MIRVYKFGADAPRVNIDIVQSQMRAAHAYRNVLVTIERGRRQALRELEDTTEVAAALELVKAATRSTRVGAIKALWKARTEAVRNARCPNDALAWWADRPYSPLYHTERIKLLDATIRRDARALTDAYWGTYLGIEAAADQVRQTPLYDRDSVTPSDPRFVRWHHLPGREAYGEGQVGVQFQGGLLTPKALGGTDTRVRLLRDPPRPDGRPSKWATFMLRVGSTQARTPIWAETRVRISREIPDNAKWKWVRLSCRHEAFYPRWSVEITLDIPGDSPRMLDTELAGAIAVEVAWDKPDDQLCVGYWRDHTGATGRIHLSEFDEQGIRKPDGIQAVRAALVNTLKIELARAFIEQAPIDGQQWPEWLRRAANTQGLWKSQGRFHELVHQWRDLKCDLARPVYDILQKWELRDAHLWEYEACSRGQALRRRREFYRVLAAKWARQYKHLIIDDRALDREARWGEASDLRFTAAPAEFRETLAHAFGPEDTSKHPYRLASSKAVAASEETSGDSDVSDDRSWCERAMTAYIAGQAAPTRKTRKRAVHGVGGAWKSRKEAKGKVGVRADDRSDRVLG